MARLVLLGVLVATASMGAGEPPRPGGGGRPHGRDAEAAYDARSAGRIRPLRDIERSVIPGMGGASYLGPEYDPSSSTYRLKFMRNGSVIWVDVDGRNGQVIGKSGN